VQARCERADECLTALLGVASSRGSWGGVTLAPCATVADDQPIASLTRAAIRPRHAAAFWRHTPASEASLAQAPGCRLAVGLGEAPLLRQATFSLWDHSAAMTAYARQGAHLAASRGAWQHDWFSEWMFVRFAPLSIEGTWQGRAYG
jgi:spheroidene monooxygenase